MTGRFISKDPVFSIFEPDRANPFTYCANNPYKYTDPNGEFFWIAVGIFALTGGISGGIIAEQAGGNFWRGFALGALAGASIPLSAGIGGIGGVAGTGLSMYNYANTMQRCQMGNITTQEVWMSVLGAATSFATGGLLKGVEGWGAQIVTRALLSTATSTLVKIIVDPNNINGKEILNNFGMNLAYSAAMVGLDRLNTKKKIDIEVILDEDRDNIGRLRVIDQDGNELAEYDVLGRGSGPQHENRLAENADTPYGNYDMTETVDTSDWPERSFGSQDAVRIDPIGGEALNAEGADRSGFLVHGGAPETRANMPWGNTLRPTHGCLRLSNADMSNLLEVVQGYELGTLTIQRP